MHQLLIERLGPIHHCEFTIRQYTFLTGYQASGKSTIAKAVYFFRTLKGDIYQLMLRRQYETLNIQQGYAQIEDTEHQTLVSEFERHVRNKFLSTFGTSYCMDRDMRLCYRYQDGVEITICLKESHDKLTPNYVWVEYSQQIRNFLIMRENDAAQPRISAELDTLFNDPFETVYIPAGRSVLTILGSQFSYLYSTMDDTQKRLLDACTRDYLELVMRLRPQFSNGLEGLLAGKQVSEIEQELFLEALRLIRQVLKGRYVASDGEERIWVAKDSYVKINFASSGQQEIVWILNLLFYYLVLQKPVFFIIEEPESNLFPASQKAVIELIALVVGAGNAVLLTTHSPYVLGAVNNLLYAGTVGKLANRQVSEIVSPSKWIDSSVCDARFVQNGEAKSCMDNELAQIDNALLDQISHDINLEYDRLFEVEQAVEGDASCR